MMTTPTLPVQPIDVDDIQELDLDGYHISDFGVKEQADCSLIFKHHKLICKTHTQILSQHSVYLKTMIDSLKKPTLSYQTLVIQLALEPDQVLSKVSEDMIRYMIGLFYHPVVATSMTDTPKFDQWIDLYMLMNYLDITTIKPLITAEWKKVLDSNKLSVGPVSNLFPNGITLLNNGATYGQIQDILSKCTDWGTPQADQRLKETYSYECCIVYMQIATCSLAYNTSLFDKLADVINTHYKQPLSSSIEALKEITGLMNSRINTTHHAIQFHLDHRKNCRICKNRLVEEEAKKQAKRQKTK